MFQEPGEIEAEIDNVGTAEVLKNIMTIQKSGPPLLPKGKAFRTDAPIRRPSWLSEEDLNYYANKFEQKGFNGGLNYYRSLDLYVILQILSLFN